MPQPVHIELAVPGLALGWVVAEGCSAGTSPPGLLLLARLSSDEPRATPVKDGQATKTPPESTHVLGVIYAPAELSLEAGVAAARMGDLLSRFGHAEATAGILGSGQDR